MAVSQTLNGPRRDGPRPDTPQPDNTQPDNTRPAATRRAELASFLRARRERLTPQQVGLPPGPRRRTPGLRREELALLAGVGITWYTWLEQGRPINASVQVLDAVARALRLDQAERAHLYQLAEAAPVHAVVAAETVPPALTDILTSFSPNPAILVNGRFDILESNEGHQSVFRNWHSMPCVHRNLLWCGITEPSAREKFLNYDDEIPYLVARLRANYAAHVGDPDWEEDIRRLTDLSPEFGELWARHEVCEAEQRLRIFLDPDAGQLRFTINELAIAAVPGMYFIVYTPQDEPTRTRLTQLSALRAAQVPGRSGLDNFDLTVRGDPPRPARAAQPARFGRQFRK